MSKVYLVNPDIIERYANSESCKDIAKRYGVATDTICRALRNCGAQVPEKRHCRPWTQAEFKLAVRLRSEGRKKKEIADLMGRSFHSVESKLRYRQRLQNAELHMRRRGVDYSEAA